MCIRDRQKHHHHDAQIHSQPDQRGYYQQQHHQLPQKQEQLHHSEPLQGFGKANYVMNGGGGIGVNINTELLPQLTSKPLEIPSGWNRSNSQRQMHQSINIQPAHQQQQPFEQSREPFRQHLEQTRLHHGNEQQGELLPNSNSLEALAAASDAANGGTGSATKESLRAVSALFTAGRNGGSSSETHESRNGMYNMF